MSIMAVDINNRFYYDSMKVTVIKNTAFPGNVNVTPTKLTTAVHTYIICTINGNKPTTNSSFIWKDFFLLSN